MAEFIHVKEVGLRDGLQLIKTKLPTSIKKEWLKKQVNAGFKEVEISSMVSKTLLPQFSDAAEMINFAKQFSDCSSSVLVPNLRGARLAFDAKAQKIIFVVSASESHNLANVNMTIKQSLGELKEIMYLREKTPEIKGISIIGSISTSFGCSIAGNISEKSVLKIVEKMLLLGVNEISIADTVGYANPRQVKSLMNKAIKLSKSVPVIGHFHDTRGFGLANLVAAIDEGVKKFDASLRGLGGCPYAPGASGNIATEDCVNLLESMGYNTGIDLEKLKELCRDIAHWMPNETLYGKFTTT